MSKYIWISIVILLRDLKLAFHNKAELLNPLLFFIMVIVLFPLSFGSDKALLKQLTAGIIWLAALLSSGLSLETLFRSDFEDGSIEQFTLSSCPLTLLVIVKVLAHWLSFGVPLILTAVLSGLVLSLPEQTVTALLLTLLLGTPTLSLTGAIVTALTIGLRGGMLLHLILWPLTMPILIFSMLAVHNASVGQSIEAELYFLAGILVLTITLAPLATATALKIRLS